MQSSTTIQKAGVWHMRSASAAKPTMLQWAMMGVAAALIAGILSGFLLGHAPVGGLARQNQKLARQLATQANSNGVRIANLERQLAAATQNHRHCFTDDADVQHIQTFISEANYRTAAALAQLDLSNANKPACPLTFAGLAALWYQSSIDALLATPPSGPTDMTPVLTWQGIERQADSFGVPLSERLSPLTVFTMAYANHDWRLAQASFLVAWRNQMVGPGNVTLIQTYYAALTNLGVALSHQPEASAQKAGYAMLATAAAIGAAYNVGGEAATDLRHVFGFRAWPRPDDSNPVLVARKAAGRR